MEPGRLEAGCDEAGRGPLAGPVYAAAVILPPDFFHPLLDDSKKMSEKAEEIDRLNILGASLEGMRRAVRKLAVRPDFLLIDGNRFRPFDGYPYRTVVHGDATYASIAAASVLAKTWRDERMRELARQYPQYGWDHNMGYPTPEHIAALKAYGPTPEHRKSFHPKELEPSLF